VQRMAQRAQRRFLHRFAQGRVGMDGAAMSSRRAPISRLWQTRWTIRKPTPTACQPTIR
jgi:hypothetical protein